MTQRYADIMPADRLAPDGTPWTFWLKQSKGKASMLLPPQVLTLYGVQGCVYQGHTHGQPQFVVPGHGLQTLTPEQARDSGITRLSEAELWAGGLKR